MTDLDLEQIKAIADPGRPSEAGGELLNAHQGTSTSSPQSAGGIAELRATGLSYAQVGEALGVSRGRIAQLKGACLGDRAGSSSRQGGGYHDAVRTSGLERPVIDMKTSRRNLI